MNAFPQFMKDPANRIRQSSQATRGVEGYVFDGVNGTQWHFGRALKMRHPPNTLTITMNTWWSCRAVIR